MAKQRDSKKRVKARKGKAMNIKFKYKYGKLVNEIMMSTMEDIRVFLNVPLRYIY